jgi:hypothetical protein
LSTSVSGAVHPPGTCHFFARPVLDTYADWAQRVFPPEQLATPSSGPDWVRNSQGLSNLLIYAMGLDPDDPELSELPRIEQDPGDGRWGYRFRIRPNAADYSWRAAFSTNLGTWSSFNGSANSTGYDDGVQRHFRKVSTTARPPLFFRLEVTPLAE